MNSLRMRKMFAGASVVAITLAQAAPALAAYRDVSSDAWYGPAVMDFADKGYLDMSQTQFRPGDLATRSEFTKLLVELNGGILGTAPAVPSFDDVAVGAWYFGYLEEAGAEGWVKGDGNCYGAHPCNARPNANVNRAEAAALINRAFGVSATGEAPTFVDNPSGQWYTEDIQTAADNCVLQGDDATGKVRPADPMNRAEMVVMLHRVDAGMQYPNCGGGGMEDTHVINSADAVSATEVEVEFGTEVDQASAEDPENYSVPGFTVTGVELVNDTTVRLTLDQPMAPGEDYTVSATVEGSDGEAIDDSADFAGYSALEQGEGALEISLNPNTPVGDTIPKGAVGINMVSVDLTASCEDDVVVETMTVIHEGFGDEADIDGVYFSIDGARVARKRTIDSEDQTADIRFSSPLVVPACETVTVDMMMDLLTAAATNGEHNFVIELASDIFSNAQSVSGNFPVRGNTFEVAAVTTGTVSIEYRSVTPTTVDVGDEAVVLGKFEASINSVEDQTLYTITMENEGSASDGDFTNLRVRRTDGTVLTNTVAQTVNDFVTFTFDPPFTVLEGDKVTFEAIGDVVDGAADTVKLEFDETSDIFAVGSLYGYGVNGQLYGSRVTIAASPTVSTVTINAGELTIEVSGPATEQYTADDDDVVLASLRTVTGGEDVDVNELFALVQAQTSTGQALCYTASGGYDSGSEQIAEVLEDVELRNKKTGRTIDGVSVKTTTATTAKCATGVETYAVFRFDDFVLRGSEDWELRVDFIDNGSTKHPENGDKFKIEICTEEKPLSGSTPTCDFSVTGEAAVITYNLDADGLSTGDRVDDIRPGGVVAGNFQEIAAPVLFITQKSTGSSDTAVENAKSVVLARFEAKAGEAEDVYLTQLIFNAHSGSLLSGQNYTLAVDADENGTYETVVQSGESGQGSPATVTFDEFIGGGFTVKAEDTVQFEVRVDVSSSLASSNLRVGFATGSTTISTVVEAEEADDGSALTAVTAATLNSSTCGKGICLKTATSKLYTLKNQGNLFVSKDSSPIRNRQLLGGTLGDEVLRLELRAEDEGVDVTDFIVTVASTEGMAGAALPSGIDSVELWRSGESTKFATATQANCRADAFCAKLESQQLVVPEGQRVDVLVRPKVKTDQQGGSISGQDVKAFLARGTGATLTTTSTGGTAVVARGAESSNDLTQNNDNAVADGEVFIGRDSVGENAAIAGNMNDVVLAKITSIVNAHLTGNPNVPSGPDVTIAKFQFTAANHSNTDGGLNKAVLSGVVFQVTAADMRFNAANFQVYNDGNASTKTACTMTGSTAGQSSPHSNSGSFYVVCRNINGTIDTNIDAGGLLTLALEGDIVNKDLSSTQQANLTVKLINFSERARATFGGTATTSSNFLWFDDVPSNAGATSFTWVEYPTTEVSSTSYKD